MGEGGWIALLMLGGTGVVLLVAFINHKPTPTFPVRVNGNGNSESYRREIMNLKSENTRYQDELEGLKMEMSILAAVNLRLNRNIVRLNKIIKDYEKGQ